MPKLRIARKLVFKSMVESKPAITRAFLVVMTIGHRVLPCSATALQNDLLPTIIQTISTTLVTWPKTGDYLQRPTPVTGERTGGFYKPILLASTKLQSKDYH